MSQIQTLVIPGDAVGKGRPRFSNRGKFVRAYTPDKTRSYTDMVKILADLAGINKPQEGPFKIEIYIAVKYPSRLTRQQRIDIANGKMYPTKKPDVDNVEKMILDALIGKAYFDDKQVVDSHPIKYYHTEPKVTVKIERIET